MRIAYCKRITKKGMERKKEMHHTDKETKTKCWFGWISPDGQTFPCDYHGHFDLAKKLAGTLGVHDDRPMRNPELLLEQHGWVKVTKDPFGPAEKLRSAILASRMYITRTQARTLADLGFDQNHDYLDLVEMSEMRWAV